MLGLSSLPAGAQSLAVMPQVEVEASRVANPAPAGTFAMPVTALRFEPAVDIHGRNLAEGQADVTVRGGTFENTGLQLGAISPYDAQTGHYLMEVPVAAQMLSTPRVLTGDALALGPFNATAGAVAYGWRPVRTTGLLAVGAGEDRLGRVEFYQGIGAARTPAGMRVGADLSVAHSQSDGAVRYGDHRFDRANARLQLAKERWQTDVFAGYQAKQFGWVNLYTPFNSPEAENLQTVLFAVNHRADLADGDFVEAGVFHRRNKDDYAFNRFAPLGPVHPFQHTTWSDGAAFGARRSFGAMAWTLRAEVGADEIRSTSLLAGRYRSRTMGRLVVVPQWRWSGDAGSSTLLSAGLGWDDSNRDAGVVTPVIALARERRGGFVRRWTLSYAKNSQLPSYTALNSSATAGLFRGNPNLGRSVSHNVELKAQAAADGWSGEAAVFWRRDAALVDWTFRTGVTARSANAVDVDVGGAEVVLRRSWRRFDLIAGYTVLAKDADYRGAAVTASFYALNYARHRLTAAMIARLGGGFELRIDNAARVQAENALRTIGGRRALATTAGLAYRPPSWRAVEFTAQVENLWDSDFQDVPAVPAAPRQFALGATYSW